MMIKLYGFALSNYYNMVKFTLLEKGIDFEEVEVPPNQKAEFLAKSPMGKIPCIETSQGFISETNSIMEYLDQSVSPPTLLPADPFTAAKVRELMKVLELYIELSVRRHYNEVFFSKERDTVAFEEVRPVLEKGLNALKSLASFDPYLTGDEFTLADIMAVYTFVYAVPVAQAVYDWDIVAEVPGLQASLDNIGLRDAAQKVSADHEAAMAEHNPQS